MTIARKEKRKLILFIIILIGIISWCNSREKVDFYVNESRLNQWYSEEKLLFYGIPVRINFYPTDKILAQKIWEYLNTIDTIFNDYDQTSEIGKINGAKKSGPVKISSTLAEAIHKSLKVYDITNGSFDISMKLLKNLWEDKEKQGILPTQFEIDMALKYCGLNNVSAIDQTLTLAVNEMEFDFGGIIKGIAVDSIVEMLKNHNIKSALVQIGGETAVFGKSQRMKPFVIGIQNPTELDNLYNMVNDQGKGLSISTSGAYRNPIMIGDQEYYHIINPKSGWPVDKKVLSVSIVFQSTGKNWLADALTTACVVMGPDRSVQIVEKLEGDVLFLMRNKDTIREIKSLGWGRLTR